MDKFHGRDHKIQGTISKELQQNVRYIESVMVDCADLVKKEFSVGRRHHIPVYVAYMDGLVNVSLIQESVIRPLLLEKAVSARELDGWVIQSADRKWISTMDEAFNGILSGNTVVFMEGEDQAIQISTKLPPNRGVQTADQEVAMVGSKDSFNESLRINTALIRRRIRDTRLKVIQKQLGTRSRTDYALMYVEDLAKEDVVEKIKTQLDKICVDALFDNGMLEQYLEKEAKSPFPAYQLTQRPDKTASALLEGRIAVILDNSPEALLLPVTMNVFFQASDDYYNRWETATFARILRYLAAFLAVGLPGFYVAIAGFHPEVLPTSFLLALVSARETVPFPVVVEVVIMEIAFELLREAGIRLPGQLGGTIGVVGGLIVGQAAVDAHIVSTIVVIVVALTAIASFAIPNEIFTGAVRLLKFFLIFVCTVWGLYGFFLGFLAIFLHLFSLEHYGVPYMYPSCTAKGKNVDAFQDDVVRAPLKFMTYRPEFTKKGARRRQKNE
jgi:spore germination protein